MSNDDTSELKAANKRAERERLGRLALIDSVTAAINEDHDTVEDLKAAVRRALEARP